MRTIRFGLLVSLLLSIVLTCWSSNPPTTPVNIEVDLFISTTCPYCKSIDQFFKALEPEYSWLNVHRYVINESIPDLDTFNKYLHNYGANDFIVPSVFFCNTRWKGFKEAENQVQLLDGLKYCHAQMVKTGSLSPASQQVLQQMALASWYENNIIDKPSAALVLPGLAILDALGATAIFSILCLFAFLVIQKSRHRQYQSAIVYLITVGIAHQVQQNHPIFFFQLMSYLRIPAMLIGLGLVAYVLIVHYKRLSRKQENPSWLVLSVVLFTAFAVQAYLQTATPNFSLVFSQWMDAQHFSSMREFFYKLLYQYIYLMIIGGVAVGLVALEKLKRWAKHKKFIDEFAWQYLLIIGLILIAYPFLLTEPIFVFITITIALAASFIAKRLKRN